MLRVVSTSLAIRTCAFGLLVVGAGRAPAGEEATVPSVRSLGANVVDAVLFKNGLALLRREVELPGAGVYLLEDLPVASHGTFWAIPKNSATKIESLVSQMVRRVEDSEATNLWDLARANLGRDVQLQIGNDEWASGVLEEWHERQPRFPMPLSEAMRSSAYAEYWSPPRDARVSLGWAPPAGQEPGFALFRTAQGVQAVPAGTIRGIRSTSGTLSTVLRRQMPGVGVRIEATGPGGIVEFLGLSFGLTWAPSYLVDVSHPEHARVTLRADVLNDLATLSNVRVQFVTGFPHFAYAHVPSPHALIGTTPDFLQMLVAATSSRADASSAPVQQQQARPVRIDAIGDVGIDFPDLEKIEGTNQDGLFLYPQQSVSLRRGERGAYPVFSVPSSSRHVFLLSLEDSMDREGRWRWSGASGRTDGVDPSTALPVWHALELTNSATAPWTTAPATVMQDGRITGQDTLYYTPPGGTSRLNLSRAMDVMAKNTERELDRIRNTWVAGATWDIVTIEGEIQVANHRSEAITLRITKRLSGAVTDHEPPATIETTTQNLHSVNTRQVLEWEVRIQPRETSVLRYAYKVYIR